MFNMGIGEIFLIFVVILLVVGPDKLPSFAKTIAKYFGEFNRAKHEIKNAVMSPSDEAEFRTLVSGNVSPKSAELSPESTPIARNSLESKDG